MISDECKEVSKNFTILDFEAVVLANEKISNLTRYGVRNEIAENDGVEISWSNGSKNWFSGNRKIQKGTEMRLDANETFLPISPMRFERIKACLDELPLYAFSTESWTRKETSQEESCLGWAIFQLARIQREKFQEKNR
jgi:hypothetical protein